MPNHVPQSRRYGVRTGAREATLEDLTPRPVCAFCSRNARTVDTPRVKVRVERAVVIRRDGEIVALCRCHGAACEVTFVGRDPTEEDIELAEAFRG